MPAGMPAPGVHARAACTAGPACAAAVPDFPLSSGAGPPRPAWPPLAPLIVQVDVAAVNRFISAAVPDLTREQKAALKEAGQQDGGHKRGEPASGGGEAGGHGDAELAAAAFLEEAMVELGGGGAAGGEAVAAGGKKQKKKQAKRSRK